MRSTTLLAFSLCLSALASAAAADTPINRTLPLDADGDVEISNIAGDVTVTGWDRAEVAVEGRLGPGVERLEVEGDRRRVVIKVIPSRKRGGEAFLVVKIPKGASLEAGTVSAPIAVSGVSGSLEAASVSGDLIIGEGLRDIRSETVSGSIEIGSCRGFVRASSVSGTIDIAYAENLLEASTVSGSIDARGAKLESVELEAVSGSVRFAGTLNNRGRLQASSHSGDVVLALPRSLGADISASSFSGSIRNALGPQATRNSHGPGRELSFRLSGGGARISVESFSGDVVFEAGKD
jgi:DUF4097 and DUF4098 domain-containing protein YvlB